MNSPTPRRRPWLTGAVLAGSLLLLVTGCATDDDVISSSTGPGGAESSSPAEEPGAGSDEESAPGPADDAGSGTGEPGSGTGEPGQSEGDYVIVDGERLPVMFSGFTVDESKVAARTVASYCDSNHMRTGQFRAWGYLVDDAGQVLTTDTNWIGLVRLTLNTRDDIEVAPYVDVELHDRGLWLSLVDPNPADPDGGFSVEGKTATGDFLVPDMNGGPDQRVEFRVACPE